LPAGTSTSSQVLRGSTWWEKFHWLAAVITNPVVNGVKDTPTRRVINRAVKFLSTPRTCFAFVVDDHHQLACLFAGSPEESWSRAADYSAQLHISTSTSLSGASSA